MIHKGIKISTGLDWNKDRFQKDIASYKDGTELYIDVTDKKPSKTLQQIRYIYLLIGFIADHTGYTKEQSKTVIKDFRKMYEDFEYIDEGNIAKDKTIRRYESFANLKLKEAESLIEYLLDLCEHLEIKVIPKEEYFET